MNMSHSSMPQAGVKLKKRKISMFFSPCEQVNFYKYHVIPVSRAKIYIVIFQDLQKTPLQIFAQLIIILQTINSENVIEKYFQHIKLCPKMCGKCKIVRKNTKLSN